MDTNCNDKMEQFLTLANNVLDNLKKEQEISKQLNIQASKTISTLRNILLVVIIPVIGAFVQIETSLSDKSNTVDVVSKKEAVVVHRLNADNIQKIAGVLSSDPETLKVVEEFNNGYLQMVEKIYSK